jgi:hypothetical protein
MKHLLTIVALAGLAGVSLGLFAGCNGEDGDTEAGANGDTEVMYVNQRCPIMPANKIDAENVPDNLVTEFHGHKVAFCCGGCPEQWEALSEEQKIEKLVAVGVEREKLEH